MINAKLSMLLAASIMAVATAACSGPENTASRAMPAETPMAGPNEIAVVDTAAVDSGTTDFVEKAVNSNMFEIEASKIALERSKGQPVKDFAKMLVDAHTTALGELQSLSTAAMVTAPTAMNTARNTRASATPTSSHTGNDTRCAQPRSSGLGWAASEMCTWGRVLSPRVPW